jgi:CheY-like chemotaxis protein
LHESVFSRTEEYLAAADNRVMNSIVTRSAVRERQSNQSATSVHAISTLSVPAGREAATLRILLVDDCRLQQLLGSALLSLWGIQPQLASDGLEAVLLAGEQRFDLILMDIQMGVLDGVAASWRIRQNERHHGGGEVPIVAYTAEPLGACERAWADAGISAALAKPCRPVEMGECLKHWCGVQPEPLRH